MAKSENVLKATSAAHFTLQGKGGVGKSLVSAFLAQYFGHVGANVKCIDTDPVNQTFVNYKGLKAEHLDLMDGSRVNERRFDNLMERVLFEEGVFVIDNGSSSFIPLSNYLIENNAIQIMKDSNRNVFIHCVITGGQALSDTLSGFKSLAEQTNSNNIVIWLNEYFGPIQSEGKTFTDMKVFTEHKDKILGIVRIPKRNSDTYGKDIEEMAAKKKTFAEVLEEPEFEFMAKLRIKEIQKDIFKQLDAVGF